MKFTIFGSRGFIGSNLLQKLKHSNVEYYTPDIHDDKILKENLGHVIYAIGLTADFRERQFDTVETHVCLLHDLLKNATFDSFLYLSSTRVYSNLTDECTSLKVNPTKPDDLYNISKIMGESLCMASDKPNIRIVRLSNVIGNNFTSNDFLSSIIRDAIEKKIIKLNISLLSEKDYVDINDVVEIIPKIVIGGKNKIYNLASGSNTKTKDIVNEIIRLTDCNVDINKDAKEYSFPIISINRLKNEFNYHPVNVLGKLETIIRSFENEYKKQSTL